jgi:hypothetical protein
VTSKIKWFAPNPRANRKRYWIWTDFFLAPWHCLFPLSLLLLYKHEEATEQRNRYPPTLTHVTTEGQQWQDISWTQVQLAFFSVLKERLACKLECQVDFTNITAVTKSQVIYQNKIISRISLPGGVGRQKLYAISFNWLPETNAFQWHSIVPPITRRWQAHLEPVPLWAYASNPSFLGGGDRRILSLRSVWGKLARSCLKTKIQMKGWDMPQVYQNPKIQTTTKPVLPTQTH